MLQHYYATEKPLPTESRELCHLLRAKSKVEKDAIASVTDRFWRKTDEGLVNGRALTEMHRASDSENGNEQRKAAERERQKRTREHRKKLYEQLKEMGVTPSFDATTTELNVLLKAVVTRDVTPTVTRTVTRDYTANQTPDSRLQTPEKEKTKSKDSSATADVSPSPETAKGAPRLPPCPIDEIIAAYHEQLPALPRLMVRNDKRDKLISARWRQVFEEGKVHNREEAIDLFRKYFEFVRDSKFLTGKAAPQKDRTPFMANLEWLMSPSNYANTVEGKYHR